MYEAIGTRELYQPIHVVCLGISNKSVAVPYIPVYIHTVYNTDYVVVYV